MACCGAVFPESRRHPFNAWRNCSVFGGQASRNVWRTLRGQGLISAKRGQIRFSYNLGKICCDCIRLIEREYEQRLGSVAPTEAGPQMQGSIPNRAFGPSYATDPLMEFLASLRSRVSLRCKPVLSNRSANLLHGR
jgi:hypothetical protein